jgi:hypothetical protein
LPLALDYCFARLGNRNGGAGVLQASLGSLVAAIGEVARAEAPVHDEDVMTRLASAYGDQRVGPRMARQLESALSTAERRGVIVRRDGFVYLPNETVQVRSRSGTAIPAERIAPEEYRETVLLVLRSNSALPKVELVAAVRTVLGFSRTGSKLEERIGQAIDWLLHAGKVGEGSTGLAAIS